MIEWIPALVYASICYGVLIYGLIKKHVMKG